MVMRNLHVGVQLYFCIRCKYSCICNRKAFGDGRKFWNSGDDL